MNDKTELADELKSHKETGEMEMVAYLNRRLSGIEKQIDRINEILKDLQFNHNGSERVLRSYEIGFRKGLAEIWSSKF